MIQTNPITIPFSKRKTLVLLMGAIAFVAAGYWLLFGTVTFGNALLDNLLLIKITGLVSVIFFGIAIYFLIGNLRTQGPGLIIDDTGIEDYSSSLSTSKIYWKDIEAIEVMTIKSQIVILFKVSNPKTYIEAQRNKLKRKMLELNYKWYGTPVSSSANGLRISSVELLQLVSDRFEVYKSTK